jgi:hypothetical protein
MNNEEQLNLERDISTPPPDFGRTILAEPVDVSAEDLLNRIISVWKPIAALGTWRDEDLGDWPSDDECISSLPAWFQKKINFSKEAWLSDLHDREWVWWHGSVVEGYVKIDLNSNSLPLSTWMLEVVIELSGGDVKYRDKWLTPSEANAVLKQS